MSPDKKTAGRRARLAPKPITGFGHPVDEANGAAAEAEARAAHLQVAPPPTDEAAGEQQAAPAHQAPQPAGEPAPAAAQLPARRDEAATDAARAGLPAPAGEQALAPRPAPAELSDLTRQATVMVGVDVAERFRDYQKEQGRLGGQPTNTEIVLEALNDADGRYAALIAARQPQHDPSLRFPGRAYRRRATSEPRRTTQLAFRPSHAELEEIDRLWLEAGARSRSDFLDAVLDHFLPPARRRRIPGRVSDT